MSPGDLDFGELDFGDLLAGVPGVVVVDEAEDDALQRVARRITGQHAELLVQFTQTAFSQSDAREMARETLELATNLTRLATAAGNHDQVELLADFARHTTALTIATGRHRDRTRALAGLRDWIPHFATTLDADDADRLVQVVRPVSFPLRKVLKGVPGVGRARLTRLYAAGLHTLETLSNGTTEEIAAVTGMPMNVAEQVLRAAHSYAREERLRCLLDMQTRAAQFQRMLEVLPAESDDNLRNAARDALIQMQRALENLENDS